MFYNLVFIYNFECFVQSSFFQKYIDWLNDWTGNFPDNLKFADITSIFKKEDPINKENYRLVSALPNISKSFEKLWQKQMNDYINNFLSPYLCGYRKGFSTQLAPLSSTEK